MFFSRVALRVRPLKKNESDIFLIRDENNVVVENETFHVDRVYQPQSTQEDIFKFTLLPLMDAFERGENVTLIAYGQTGSGKTYSLGTGFESNLDGGLIYRCAHWLFSSMIEKSSKSLGRQSFEIHIAFQKDIQNMTHIKDEHRIDSVGQLQNFLQENSSESKSSVFSITLHQHISDGDIIQSVENDIPDKHIISTLQFIHLASEFNCPNSLSIAKRRHVSSFSVEKSHILLLACVSPSISDTTETLKVLHSIRSLRNSDDLQLQLDHSHAEIEILKQQLADARHYHGPPSSSSSSRRLNNKKRPVMHRMKSSSANLPSKKKNIDGLLELLRKEYLYTTDEKSLDESLKENHNDILDENELEALSVPSWSDAPPPPKSATSSKRKSISLDSMWDDTDSSMTTTTHKTTSLLVTSSKSKDMSTKRQSKNIVKMLHQIQADLLVKRELVGQLDKAQAQFIQMKSNYETRLNELKDHLLDMQAQRDAALRKSSSSIVPIAGKTTAVHHLRENRQASEVRSQYEVKLKLLVAENLELRKKQRQSTTQGQTSQAKAEGIIGRLRADIEALKLDKKQLHRNLKSELEKSRELQSTQQKQVQTFKRRELMASDAKLKLEQAHEAQSQVLKKRTEELAALNLQIRHLTNLLRRAANEGTFLNEPTLEKILHDSSSASATTANSPKNMKRPTSRLFTPNGNSSTTSSPID
ncbi:P-loop containing nucleoside triphosphate hydrolase protein [Mucor mucedo]|uniref:P-loop containing nucleoside triphosphate hydrolase protein n=1 Tax=Mucor mucedo TaxID=29922 RepID=UPI00221E5054|nr:P-loop containing nucleoside triphosphate hydrolase protein [Mucor mucedo]KAI7896718.1 P-loop containing nucleoside triphosphate hydrolase protein [Mucor mucedo]